MASCPTPDGTKARPYPMKQGRLFTLLGTYKVDGRAVDLADPVRTGRSQLRREGSRIEAAVVPSASMTVTVTPAVVGTYTLTLGATVTSTLEPGLYVADVEFEDTGTPNPDDVIGTDVFYILVGRQVTV